MTTRPDTPRRAPLAGGWRVSTINALEFHVRELGVMPPEVQAAMVAWCRAHGIDPDDVPQTAAIVRDPNRCTITYAEYVRTPTGDRIYGPDGQLMVVPCRMQGETPPLPFPDVVLAWGRRR